MIRLFVGTDCNNCDLESQAVLEYSVRKHASEPVEITWMRVSKKGPWSGWQTGSARTPFTHFRWSIPSVCNYEGRAIYTDSDFLFLADIAELWHQPIPGVLLAKTKNEKLGNSSCMLIDCARAKGHIPTIEELRKMPDAHATVERHFKDTPGLATSFEGAWNCIDLDSKPGREHRDINDPQIKAIHYSRIEGQLQLKHCLPRLKAEGGKHWYPDADKAAARIRETGSAHWIPELQALFDQLLEEATAAGFDIERYRVDPHGEFSKRAFVYQHSTL
jgi:hypothetical protein